MTLIQAQTAYQANSKAISTEATVMQTLTSVNLIRLSSQI
ncbi:hypothetical protein CU663_23435 [Pseudomonas syringae pv. actinidifoliorum]|nr:hypothetical protein [Pseudomonas syringae pv. actinidifoliorum]